MATDGFTEDLRVRVPAAMKVAFGILEKLDPHKKEAQLAREAFALYFQSKGINLAELAKALNSDATDIHDKSFAGQLKAELQSLGLHGARGPQHAKPAQHVGSRKSQKHSSSKTH